MEVKNDNKQGTPEVGKKRKNSKSNDQSRGLGDVSIEGTRSRVDPIRVTRADSERSDIAEFAIGTETTGGILRRLTQELEEQLAYHREQAKNIEITLQRVIQLTEAENIDLIE